MFTMSVTLLVLAVVILNFANTEGIKSEYVNENFSSTYCPYFRNGPKLNVLDLVGSWSTVYTQPKAVDCFTLHIRATTDLEREQNVLRYGNFSGHVRWEDCLVEIESPLGKHFLQGNGSEAGLLENIIIQTVKDKHTLQDQTADQWAVFGRRGSEVLVMRDCLGEAAAAFARAHFWPTVEQLYAILHRSGIAPIVKGRVLCEPRDVPTGQLSISQYFSRL